MLSEDSALRPLLSAVVAFLAISYYVTGNFLWGYETHWTQPRFLQHRVTTLFSGPLHFTEDSLRRYDGSDPALPIYLAVDGMVFDVTAKPETYAVYGSYGFFSGRDGARAFATGCFETDVTHDLRELDDKTLAAVAGWQKFFANHAKYWHVGYVEHPPLTGSPPPPCDGAKKPH